MPTPIEMCRSYNQNKIIKYGKTPSGGDGPLPGIISFKLRILRTIETGMPTVIIDWGKEDSREYELTVRPTRVFVQIG